MLKLTDAELAQLRLQAWLAAAQYKTITERYRGQPAEDRAAELMDWLLQPRRDGG